MKADVRISIKDVLLTMSNAQPSCAERLECAALRRCYFWVLLKTGQYLRKRRGAAHSKRSATSIARALLLPGESSQECKRK
jgi:hypothetical protein